MEIHNDYSWCICRKEEVMADRGNISKQADTSLYPPRQIKAVVKGLGLNVVGESNSNIILYCPFHNNTHTACFYISEETGAWICFNPSCGEAGGIKELVKKILGKNEFETLRFILSKRPSADDMFEDTLNSVLEEKPDFVEFSQQTLNNLYAELGGSQEAKDYFVSRGINEESMKHFKLGYSSKMGMVIVPVHSPDGMPVGLVGRSIKEKVFKNSTNLPKNKTMFNIHRAKRIGEHVIIVESSFDAIRVHQAGFPNVVATLGGHLSKENIFLLNRYFNRITIMTDSDLAGRELGLSIASRLKNKDILWASYEYGKIYPHDAKDVGDMTDEEIKACIKNSVSDIEYRSWNS
jgi:DNA primase